MALRGLRLTERSHSAQLHSLSIATGRFIQVPELDERLDFGLNLIVSQEVSSLTVMTNVAGLLT